MKIHVRQSGYVEKGACMETASRCAGGWIVDAKFQRVPECGLLNSNAIHVSLHRCQKCRVKPILPGPSG